MDYRWNTRFRNIGYRDGLRNGETDRRIGILCKYAFYSFTSESQYQRDYSRGYRDGVLGIAPDLRG